MKGAVILLSGGLDSAVCLKKAVDEGVAELCLTFDYGQKAAKKEIEAARKLCAKYGRSDGKLYGECDADASGGRDGLGSEQEWCVRAHCGLFRRSTRA